MNPPFSDDDFFKVFRAYNEAVFPAQIIIYAASVVILYFIIRRSYKTAHWPAIILGLIWLWTGATYHLLFFSTINPAANAFGVLFLIQGILLIWIGWKRRLSFQSPKGIYGGIAWFLIGYAMILYPILGRLFGHHYPAAPTFGLPCPLTIFTFGLILLAKRPFSKWILAIPTIWALIGSTAVLAFGVAQDSMLIIAAAATWLLLLIKPQP